MCGFDYSERAFFADAYRDRSVDFARTPLRGRHSPAPIIGNDVWIGSDVMLARGITIGNGAVIAAGSIVTKDVPDYAIVAGAPAQIKKYRFEPQLRAALSQSCWWDYSFVDFCDLPTVEPARFIDLFQEKKDNGLISPYSPKKIRLDEALAAIAAAP
jgi:hypothetical protein